MTKSETIIKDAASFTISGYISSVCNFLSATIVRKILDPFFMGLYTELALVFEYAKYNHLGMLDSLDRQIPYYAGKKENETKDRMASVGISFSLLTSLVCALGIIGFSILFKGRLSPTLAAGLKIVAVLVVIQSVTTFYITLVRSHHLFGFLSKYVIITALFDILLKAFLGIRFGVTGILWATVLTLVVGVYYLYKTTGLSFKILFKIPLNIVIALLGIGFPLLLAGFAFMVLRSVDRLVIIAFLSKEELGFYSIAIMVHSFIFQLPNLVYTVLFPRFYEAFGDSEDIGKLKNFLEKPTLTFAYMFPILIGLAVIVLPVFVNYVLPKYTAGIPAASILLFGTFFISITNMYGYLLVALKKQASLVIIGALSIIACVILNFIFVKILNLGIEGVALGTSISYFLYSLFLIGYAMKQYVLKLYDRLRFFASIYLPLVWVIAVFYLLRPVFSYGFKGIAADIGKMLLQILVFFAAAFPLIVHINKKVELYSRIKNAGFDFFKR